MSGWQREQFQRFGDVIIFDNTYRVNQNNIPLGLFVGIDHFDMSFVLAQVLMVFETSASFKWVFETLMEAVGNKKIQTLFTDQDQAMIETSKVLYI